MAFGDRNNKMTKSVPQNQKDFSDPLKHIQQSRQNLFERYQADENSQH